MASRIQIDFTGDASSVTRSADQAAKAINRVGDAASRHDRVMLEAAEATRRYEIAVQRFGKQSLEAAQAEAHLSDASEKVARTSRNAQEALTRANRASELGHRSATRAMDTAEKASHRYSSGLTNLGRSLRNVAIAAGGFYVLEKAFRAAFGELADAQKKTAQTMAVLKSTGGAANVTKDQVLALAGSLSRMSGIDDQVVQSGENMLLTFTKIRNEQGKGNDIFTQATKVLADMSTALGVSMPKAAIQLGKALQDPVTGITALRRVGVDLDESQRKNIKTLVEHGRLLDAQKIILRELTKEFGGSAKAAGETFPGQLSKLKNSLDDTGATILQALLPAMTRALQLVNQLVQFIQTRVAPVLGPIFRKAFADIGQAWERYGRPGVAAFIAIVRQLIPIVKPMLVELGNVIRAALALIAAIWQRWGPEITAIVKFTFKTIGRVVRPLLKALADVIQFFTDLIQGNWGKAFGHLKDAVVNIFKAIVASIRGLGTAFFNAAKAIGQAIWNGITGALSSLGEHLKDLILAPIRAVARLIVNNWPDIPGLPGPPGFLKSLAGGGGGGPSVTNPAGGGGDFSTLSGRTRARGDRGLVVRSPGTEGRDVVPALLRDGEVVLTPHDQMLLGYERIQRLLKTRGAPVVGMAGGGTARAGSRIKTTSGIEQVFERAADFLRARSWNMPLHPEITKSIGTTINPAGGRVGTWANTERGHKGAAVEPSILGNIRRFLDRRAKAGPHGFWGMQVALHEMLHVGDKIPYEGAPSEGRVEAMTMHYFPAWMATWGAAGAQYQGNDYTPYVIKQIDLIGNTLGLKPAGRLFEDGSRDWSQSQQARIFNYMKRSMQGRVAAVEMQRGGQVGGGVQKALAAALAFAKAHLGDQYTPGGTGHGERLGPNFWDCSGFAGTVTSIADPAVRPGGWTGSYFAASREATAAERASAPLLWGFNDSPNSQEHGHMGVRVNGQWFEAGGQGVIHGRSSWASYRIPPGAPSSAVSGGDPNVAPQGRGGAATSGAAIGRGVAAITGAGGVLRSGIGRALGTLLGSGFAPARAVPSGLSVGAESRITRAGIAGARAAAKAGITDPEALRAAKEKAEYDARRKALTAEITRVRGRKRAVRREIAKIKARIKDLTARMPRERTQRAAVQKAVTSLRAQRKKLDAELNGLILYEVTLVDEAQDLDLNPPAEDTGQAAGDLGIAAEAAPEPVAAAEVAAPAITPAMEQAAAQAAVAARGGQVATAFAQALGTSRDIGGGVVSLNVNVGGSLVTQGEVSKWLVDLLGRQGQFGRG